MRVLVTGAAGFIGAALCRRLCAEGHRVWGVDNLNDYYDPALKQARLAHTREGAGESFSFEKLDIADWPALSAFADKVKPELIVHLAAQAGVRYSLENPHAYAQSNLVGQVNMLEIARAHGVRHFLYASSSSVYGGNEKTPFSETDDVSRPVSLYAATKRADELMSHTYSHLYGIPATGLRFFTVYGPWGRPDMAAWLFSEAILEGRPIKVFNHGDLWRDFTHIDDIVEGVVRVMALPPKEKAPHTVYNIGNNQPVALGDFIKTLEAAIGQEAQKEMLPMQPGDVYQTYADTARLEAATGWKPATPLKEGLQSWADWFLEWRTGSPVVLSDGKERFLIKAGGSALPQKGAIS